jgi:heavy metal sensor kinase
MRLGRLPIRARLTAWFLAIFACLLLAYISAACLLNYGQLMDQLYHAEVQDMETVQGLLYFAPGNHLTLREDYFNRPESRLLLERMMEIRDDQGQVLYRNRKLAENTLGSIPSPEEGAGTFTPRTFQLPDGTHLMVISHRHSINGVALLIRLAYSTEPIRHRSQQLLGLLILLLPIAMVAAALAGYQLAGSALSPLEEMAQLTERITARRLSQRIPVTNPADELGHMAQVLNGLLERLEASFERLERFSSDVSHELRTPLASMRSVGEVGLQQNRRPDEYRDIIGSMLEEVAKLTAMIDTLLTIAHAESGQMELQKTVFPWADLVNESVAVVGVLAEEKQQTVSVSGNREIKVLADRSFLRMAVINLLDNAVKYSPAGSAIRITIQATGRSGEQQELSEVTIEDEGPGVPECAADRIFDRFYRLEESRARETGGAGLGLSIAQWVVDAHGGQILIGAAKPHGARFSIRLPIAKDPVQVTA